MTRLQWMRLAKCRGESLKVFFAETKRLSPEGVVRKYCHPCRVRYQCLIFALERETSAQKPFGVWGGTTENQRRKLKKEILTSGRPIKDVVDQWLLENDKRYSFTIELISTSGKILAVRRSVSDLPTTRAIAKDMAAEYDKGIVLIRDRSADLPVETFLS